MLQRSAFLIFVIAKVDAQFLGHGGPIRLGLARTAITPDGDTVVHICALPLLAPGGSCRQRGRGFLFLPFAASIGIGL